MNLLRKRDLLLSLKYCTIESCFSVPMLNLTLTQFPFILGFAVAGLGWGSAAIGWLAAIHHLCNAVQPPIYWLLRRRLLAPPHHRLGFWFNALPWLAVLAFPYARRAPGLGLRFRRRDRHPRQQRRCRRLVRRHRRTRAASTSAAGTSADAT
jgi:hypothetical protein